MKAHAQKQPAREWARRPGIAAAVTAALLLPAVAQADCAQIRALLSRGASVIDIADATGLSPADVAACAQAPQQRVRIDPVGPAPHGAAGPAPLGAAGPAPHGAAGPAPLGAAGPAPHGAPGPAPLGAAGPAPFGSVQR